MPYPEDLPEYKQPMISMVLEIIYIIIGLGIGLLILGWLVLEFSSIFGIPIFDL